MNKAEQTYYKQAFGKHISTAFVIGTPFQLLCAWNAIGEFEIEDYRIVLVMDRSSARNEQVFTMLKSRNMPYDVFYSNDYRTKDILDGRIARSEKVYDRIMTGEPLYLPNLIICGLYGSSDSVMVYMDDGAATIRMITGHTMYQNRYTTALKNILRPNNKRNREYQSIMQYWQEYGLHEFGFFYTIYSDIKTRKYITYPNRLDYLRLTKKEKEGEKAILIIGAETKDFSLASNVTTTEYEGILWRKLREVRKEHPNDRIIYIPHGRDKNEVVRQFCSILDIEYNRIEMAIEYYVLSSAISFSHIYGFYSTAQYTLKLLTNADVYDWVIKNQPNPAWYTIEEISMYYKKHGIHVEEIVYQRPSIMQYMRYYCQKIKGALKSK